MLGMCFNGATILPLEMQSHVALGEGHLQERVCEKKRREVNIGKKEESVNVHVDEKQELLKGQQMDRQADECESQI